MSACVFRHRGLFVGGGFARHAPHFLELRGEFWLIEAAQLPGDIGGKIARRDATVGDRREQRPGEGYAATQASARRRAFPPV